MYLAFKYRFCREKGEETLLNTGPFVSRDSSAAIRDSRSEILASSLMGHNLPITPGRSSAVTRLSRSSTRRWFSVAASMTAFQGFPAILPEWVVRGLVTTSSARFAQRGALARLPMPAICNTPSQVNADLSTRFPQSQPTTKGTPMRFIAFIIAATLMLGCSYQPRTSIPDNERVYRATFTTTKTRKQAFDDVEVELVRVFNNAKNVTQIKRPETGRIVVQALTQRMLIRDVGDFINYVYGSVPFILDIQMDDNAISFSFEVNGPAECTMDNGKYGIQRTSEYPTDMIPVLNDFKATAAALSKAVGGVLKEETAIPKPAPKKEAQGSMNGGKGQGEWNP